MNSVVNDTLCTGVFELQPLGDKSGRTHRPAVTATDEDSLIDTQVYRDAGARPHADVSRTHHST